MSLLRAILAGRKHLMKVQIIRSRRKTIQTSVNVDGEVILRVPVRTSQAEIEKVLREEKDWILRHLEKMKERQEKKTYSHPSQTKK